MCVYKFSFSKNEIETNQKLGSLKLLCSDNKSPPICVGETMKEHDV